MKKDAAKDIKIAFFDVDGTLAVSYTHLKGVILILKYRKISQFILLIAGVSMMSYGAVRGEATVVLSKAIKLCLECVGIG